MDRFQLYKVAFGPIRSVLSESKFSVAGPLGRVGGVCKTIQGQRDPEKENSLAGLAAAETCSNMNKELACTRVEDGQGAGMHARRGWTGS